MFARMLELIMELSNLFQGIVPVVRAVLSYEIPILEVSILEAMFGTGFIAWIGFIILETVNPL